jgi:hemerythrin-like domain-containing protein
MAATTKSKQKRGSRSRSTKGTSSTKRTTRARTKGSRPAAQQSSLAKAAARVLSGAADTVRGLVPTMGLRGNPATSLLEQQHREVERSFATALESSDARTRRKAMEDIVRQLTTHTTIEETVFYPAVREIGTEEATRMILEAFEEHHVVKLVLKEIPKVDPSDETFEAKMTVLKELVEHHVKEEEREMFPLAERQLGSERSQDLADQMAIRAGRA